MEQNPYGESDFSMSAYTNRSKMFDSLPTMMNYWNDYSDDSGSILSSSTNMTGTSDYEAELKNYF